MSYSYYELHTLFACSIFLHHNYSIKQHSQAAFWFASTWLSADALILASFLTRLLLVAPTVRSPEVAGPPPPFSSADLPRATATWRCTTRLSRPSPGCWRRSRTCTHTIWRTLRYDARGDRGRRGCRRRGKIKTQFNSESGGRGAGVVGGGAQVEEYAKEGAMWPLSANILDPVCRVGGWGCWERWGERGSLPKGG